MEADKTKLLRGKSKYEFSLRFEATWGLLLKFGFDFFELVEFEYFYNFCYELQFLRSEHGQMFSLLLLQKNAFTLGSSSKKFTISSGNLHFLYIIGENVPL